MKKLSEQENELLKILKLKLGITSNVRDELLIHLLNSAIAELKDKGLFIDLSISDRSIETFIVDYAYFKYKNTDFLGLPRYLDYQLKNLLIRECGKK